ncbi:MAG TPA: sodium:calcium antiporter [Chloroflexota bacterium]|nr:sodium:calcium antiporter [Chloroflexota bacterium]
MPVLSIILLAVSIAIVLFAAELFTNGVEWLGHKLKLGEGAVGSILAAVGTALPETLLPIVAIVGAALSGNPADKCTSHEIGIGAILGAPFMLSTAAFLVTGLSVFIFSAARRRTTDMVVNPVILERDMRFFLIVYALAVGASFLPSPPLKYAVAAALVGLYAYYVKRTLDEPTEDQGETDLERLRFHHDVDDPHLSRVWAQIIVALLLIVVGAQVFVQNMAAVATALGVPALVLSLILAPLATELPEKFNSVVWISRGKDTLALGNITGAMVFQSCIPVAVGLTLTPWMIDTPGLVSAVIALAAGTAVWAYLRLTRDLTPHILVACGTLYVAFLLYVVSGAAAATTTPHC